MTQSYLHTPGQQLFQLAVLCLLSLAPGVGGAAGPESSERMLSRQPEFEIPKDSLAGRFHRIAFGPTGEWYIGDKGRDSVRSEMESLIVKRLRSAGFEVIDPHVGVATLLHLADSLGEVSDLQTHRLHRERVAVLQIQTIVALLGGYGADGLLYWHIEESGEGPGNLLAVQIEDGGGNTVYKHRVDVGDDVTAGEILRARTAVAAVKEVLDPFCKATRR